MVVILHPPTPSSMACPGWKPASGTWALPTTSPSTGQLDPNLDAYFNWPGFFDLLGLLSGATGVQDLIGVATWAPLGINLLLLAPLLALAGG